MLNDECPQPLDLGEKGVALIEQSNNLRGLALDLDAEFVVCIKQEQHVSVARSLPQPSNRISLFVSHSGNLIRSGGVEPH
jgi:hypothetical protein